MQEENLFEGCNSVGRARKLWAQNGRKSFRLLRAAQQAPQDNEADGADEADRSDVAVDFKVVQYTVHPLTTLSHKRSSHDASGSNVGDCLIINATRGPLLGVQS